MGKRKAKRAKGRFMVDNQLLDEFGTLLGPYGLAVYMVLARYANNETQECWPSTRKIAELTGMSRTTVKKELRTLQRLGVVTVQSGRGRYNPNRYTLQDITKAVEVNGPPGDLLESSMGHQATTNGAPGDHERTKERTNICTDHKTKEHKRLMAMYREELGYKIPSAGKENKAAQSLMRAGHTSEEVIECYRHFKAEPFWREMHLSLAYVLKNIGAWKSAKDQSNEATRRAIEGLRTLG